MKLWKCDGCISHCVANNPDYIDCNDRDRHFYQLSTDTGTAVKNVKQADLSSFNLGDEFDLFFDKKWIDAIYVAHDNNFLTFLEKGKTRTTMFATINITENMIRLQCNKLPLHKRIKKGQPILIEDFELCDFVLLESINDKNEVTIFEESIKYREGSWRLPDKDELDKIGHGDKGWLTVEDV